MATPFLGQITMLACNFAPKGYALCNGQLLQISQNQALFSLLGTFYGGDGTRTFALPNMQSSLPVSFGQGAGLSNYNLGQTGGVADVTVQQAQVPIHNHAFMASTSTANTNASAIASTLVPGTPSVASAEFYGNPNPNQPALVAAPMAAGACAVVGQSQAHTNLMPSLCITFVIALQGIFPSRN